MTATLTHRTDQTTDTGPDHWYCPECHPDADVAFCGTDVSNVPEGTVPENGDVDCVVCLDLYDCPDCGGGDT